MLTNSDNSADREQRLSAIVLACLEALDSGRPLDRAELRVRYPEFADELARFLDDQERVDQCAAPLRAAAQGGSGGTGGVVRSFVSCPNVLGDYRILREIARGGMGVVYEAVQEPLGRHVALKVLPPSALPNPVHLERFRREARAAAHLHHTHIVPVFDVGQCDGVHFYAMQFIRGQGLDKVVAELRRLRNQTSVAAAEAGPDSTTNDGSVAHSLLTGRFTAPAPAPGGRDAPTPEGTPGSTSALSGDGSEAGYYRSVARLGLQAAEALAYAHRQGVLHRDVKPSNLLLDVQGTVWITDFGLAKAEGTEDLTHTGDIVGTVRYMAPERFDGRSLPESDVYGLGVTLYELLALRPAFEGGNRARLLEKVLHEPPVSLRKLDPHMPRDLETVVHKCLAKEPAERYATADALAEDLRRFLADRPIRARRSSLSERAWRWCRRNPVVAGLLAAVGMALLGVAVVSTLFALEARGRARDAEQAELQVKDKLHAESLARARAARWSGRPGARFDGLEAISQATQLARELHKSEEHFLELRNEAIACLALADLRLTSSDDVPPRSMNSDPQGNITVFRREDGGKPFTLKGPGTHAFFKLFSPDGQFLASVHHQDCLHVWNLNTRRQVFSAESWTGGMVFSPDSRLVVSAATANLVCVYETATGKTVHRLTPGERLGGFVFDPSGRQLVISTAQPSAVHFIDVDTGRRLRSVSMPVLLDGALVWRADGQLLAGPGIDRQIYTLHVPSGQTQAVLRGPIVVTTSLGFSPEGGLLASSGWDNALRLWDPLTGRLLLQRAATGVYMDSWGQVAGGSRSGARNEKWKPVESQALFTVSAVARAGPVYGVCFSQDGQLLFCAEEQGVRIWDWRARRDVGLVPAVFAGSVHTVPGDGSLLVADRQGLVRWPIRPAEQTGGTKLHIGPPERLCEGSFENSSLTHDGKVLTAIRRNSQPLVIHLNSRAVKELGSHPTARVTAVSPDGRWVATANYMGEEFPVSVRVWDVASGQVVKEYGQAEVNTNAGVSFSGDSQWLVLSTRLDYRFIRTGTWTVELVLAHEQAPKRSVAHVSNHDSALQALARGYSVLQVVDPDRRELARLPCPAEGEVAQAALSPDGAALAVLCGDGAVHVWDVRYLRTELAELELDWDQPPFRSTPDTPPVRSIRDVSVER
jgi:serine/threonine protein kinase/WD40 repeat protein